MPMKRRYFSGVVLPQRAPLTITEVRSQIVKADGSEYARLALNVYNNQITVTVETNETDILTIRNLVRSEAEFVTNLAGFLVGYGYDVEITKAFDETLGETQVFGVDIPVLAARAKYRDPMVSANAVFPLCFGELAIFLRRCLADLSFAIKRLDDTGFYCFRAIESLRQAFGHELKLVSEVSQWKAMADALRTSKQDSEKLRKHALSARHGIPRPLSDEERQELLLYTWDIVERYIDHRLAQSGSAFRVHAASHAPNASPNTE
ncbi:MAG: hypothetical protein ACKVRO_17530 [Micropepsaceae bacterium]